MQKHHFLLRRLHSLTGIVPIGVFLIVHLLTNSSVVWGGLALRGEKPPSDAAGALSGGVYYFGKEVTWINEQVPHLLLIEITLWLSIAFHSILGVYYARTGSFNTVRYGYEGNWRYKLQRLSGYIGIFYIFYHIATLRWGWTFLVPGGTKWSHSYASSTMASALRGGEDFTAIGLLVSAFYLVGVSMLVFHFANGLWTSAITWGLTVSRKAQRRWGVACLGLGTGLMVMAWMAVIGFATLSPEKARAVETKGHEKSALSEPTSASPGTPRISDLPRSSEHPAGTAER
jgi:succinate dehydrogenase / fumarate reductase, cytochrome b subunit